MAGFLFIFDLILNNVIPTYKCTTYSSEMNLVLQSNFFAYLCIENNLSGLMVTSASLREKITK